VFEITEDKMKNSMKTVAMVLGLSITGSALTCSIDGKDGFVPKNNLNIPAGIKSINGITEAEFNSAIDEVEEIYAPIISSMGAKLEIERNWTDGTVNAYASQSGKTWKVAMFGGLARHATITRDAMALVVCHEIGHHIGGAPKKGGSADGGWWGGNGGGAISWASNEGQSDYFATLKCLRKAWNNDNNAAIIKTLNAPKIVTALCKKNYKTDKVETALCVRMAMAGKSVSDLFSDLGKLPATDFAKPDTSVVSKTFDSHPKSQCRLDTYYAGSLCDVNMNEDVSQTDEVKATCHGSLGHKIGTRPLCWFKPSK
jgi:hypothetical protein